MAKFKRTHKWDNCPYALFPFGKGCPLCTYGVDLRKNPSAHDFYACMEKGVCRREKAEAENKEEVSKPNTSDGK